MTTTFHKHYVTNGKDKVRVSYFLNWDRNGTPFVSVTDKDYGENLAKIFSKAEGYRNGTERESDYFERGSVKIYKESSFFPCVVKLCEKDFLRELDYEKSQRARYGSAVDITLKSMSLKLVSTFGWSETDARNRVFV